MHKTKSTRTSKGIFFTYKSYLKILFIAIILSVGIWNVWKPLPEGINKSWDKRKVSDSQVQFLQDTTYINDKGERVANQQIFDEVIQMVRNAHSYVLVDMFLWNDYLGESTTTKRRIAQELAEELILKKKNNHDITIKVISDPINISYYGGTSKIFDEMQNAGIDVTFTNLPELRDSNPIFSTFWRIFVQNIDNLHTYLFDSHYTFRVFPNIINSGGENVTLRSFLTLLNFKANHRKLIVTDELNNNSVNFVSLVLSANPHDGSSSHSNVAVKVTGNFARDVILSETQILNLSGKNPQQPFSKEEIMEEGDINVSLITDNAIKKEVVSLIKSTEKGDSIDLLMFYISDRDIIRELTHSAERGVNVRAILDPNKDAFGREKNGIPNRQTADSLVRNSDNKIKVRWCDTHGEQCHGKMLIVTQNNKYSMMLGSANYTRRNIGGYNLETNVLVTGQYKFNAWNDAFNYFSNIWDNDGLIFTTDYSVYKDESTFKKIVSWIMENTGVGTF